MILAAAIFGLSFRLKPVPALAIIPAGKLPHYKPEEISVETTEEMATVAKPKRAPW
ncbi:MAG: hypothetical protein RMK84_15015 [Oscillochloridaceae bacterium]|nr:hypothetical protein [Chloroflexaceae bacterium]MDW8391434.1 hypothetical protein [Oscillochloridaceae bacterium]